MGQTDAFETDFWKHANLRKVWDDIVPGEPRKTIPYTLTKTPSNFIVPRWGKIIRFISMRITPGPRFMSG
jgi:hypothetical protein